MYGCVSHIHARDGNKGKIVGHHLSIMYLYRSAVFIRGVMASALISTSHHIHSDITDLVM